MSRRRDRPTRTAGAITQRPWKQFSLPYEPIKILSADNVARIHDTALTILEEIGMKVLEPRARDHYARAGARIEPGEDRVRFDRAMVEELIAKAPTSLAVAIIIPALVAMMLLRPEGLFPNSRRRRELHTAITEEGQDELTTAEETTEEGQR